jgi:hypothetical protein
MQTILNTIKTDWNFFRVARLLLGIGALVQAIMIREWPLALAGLFIAGMALANTGCGIGGCAPRTSISTKESQNINNITYEELDTKK